MIREYHFAALHIDSAEGCVRCAHCGAHTLPETTLVRVHGRWVCFSCAKRDKLPYSEPTMAQTLLEAAQN